LFGPADEFGIIPISGDELVRAAAREVDLFPMDYLAFPGGWTGELIAEVIGVAGIERLREAAQTWGDLAPRSDTDPGWVEWERRLRAVGERQLEAEIVLG